MKFSTILALRFVATLAFRHMREKMKNGIHFHSSIQDLDDLGIITIKDLPQEYGGEVPIEKFIGNKIKVNI